MATGQTEQARAEHALVHESEATVSEGRRSARVTPWPQVFVLVSLLALGALPILGAHWIGGYRNELSEHVEPARALITQLHLSLAVSGDMVLRYVITGNAVFLNRYEDEAARERRLIDELGSFIARSGGVPQQRYNELIAADSLWHRSVRTLVNTSGRGAAGAELLAEETRSANLLVAAARLDRALYHVVTQYTRRIDVAERLLSIFQFVLVGLTVLAATAVAWLGRRLRAYALESEDRRRSLERVMESRSRMTRGITHDLKNPLNVILGHVQLLEQGIRGELNPEQRQSIGVIKRAAATMLGLITTILELARAATGQIRVERQPVDVAALVEQVAEGHRPAVEGAGLTLEVSTAREIGQIETDRTRVAQVLANLLSNAVKYTPSGKVEVRATIADASAPQPGRWIAISVTDTGRGIPPERHEQIFEEFSRLETDTAEGAGLGLAISRRIARLLGGDITVASTAGMGATFTLWLPPDPAVQAAPSARAA